MASLSRAVFFGSMVGWIGWAAEVPGRVGRVDAGGWMGCGPRGRGVALSASASAAVAAVQQQQQQASQPASQPARSAAAAAARF